MARRKVQVLDQEKQNGYNTSSAKRPRIDNSPPPSREPEVPHTPLGMWREKVEARVLYDEIEPGISGAGVKYGEAVGLKERVETWKKHPYAPFKNAHDFAVADYLMGDDPSQKSINEFLSRGIDGFRCESFHNANDLFTLLENLDAGLGGESWTKHTIPRVDLIYYTRDIRECIKLLLAHLPFRDNMSFYPIQKYDQDGHRIYDEMNSGDWWWETQGQIPDGGTLIPLIFASDKTHLSNFSGDQSVWPVYLTVGNIDKAIRAETTNQAWVLVALLPVGRLKSNNTWRAAGSAGRDGENWTPDTQDCYHMAIRKLLRPLIFPEFPSREINLEQKPYRPPVYLTAGWAGFSWECADGFVRQCFPIVASWVGDNPEYDVITRSVQGSCSMCTIAKADMGHENASHLKSSPLMHDEIRELVEDGSQSAQDKLREMNIWPGQNAFWSLPGCNVYKLWQPDVLHQLWIGVAATMMGWLVSWLKGNKLLSVFNERWSTHADYPGISPLKKYHDITQWTGIERRQMMKIIMPVLIPILTSTGGKVLKYEGASEVLSCVRAFCGFSLAASQRSQNEVSLDAMESSLKEFYKYKQVFRKHLPSTKAFEAASRRELEQRISSLGREPTAEWLTKTKHELFVKHFKFGTPKMHALSHYVRSIRERGTPDNTSTDVPERMHKDLKRGYNHSNKVQYTGQLLWYMDRTTFYRYKTSALLYLFRRCGAKIEGLVTALNLKACGFKNTRAARMKNPGATAPSEYIAVERDTSTRLSGQWKKLRTLGDFFHSSRIKGDSGIIGSPYMERFSECLWKYANTCFSRETLDDWFGINGVWFKSNAKVQIYNSIHYSYRAHRNPDVFQNVVLSARITNSSSKRMCAVWLLEDDELQDTFLGRRVVLPLVYLSWTPPPLRSPPSGFDYERAPPGKWRDVGKTEVDDFQIYEFLPIPLVFCIPSGYASSPTPHESHGSVLVKTHARAIMAQISRVDGPVHLIPFEKQDKGIPGPGKVYIVNNFVDVDTYWRVY